MNNIYIKYLDGQGERSVGYTKGTRKNNYRPWWNKEIKQKRIARREANRKKRQLDRRKEMGKEQNMREILLVRIPLRNQLGRPAVNGFSNCNLILFSHFVSVIFIC